jgi:hypothetical protein
MNVLLSKVDSKIILKIMEQVYGPKVQQIHRPTYKRPYLDYIDKMYSYPNNFKFLDFALFNGQGTMSPIYIYIYINTIYLSIYLSMWGSIHF